MRLTPLLAALTVAIPVAANAQSTPVLPQLYNVVPLATNAHLNVRQSPSTRAPIIGTLAGETQSLEIVSVSGNWAEINSGEGTGWVSLRYLEAAPSVWENGVLPAHLSCFGTEPFWSASFADGRVTLATADAGDQVFTIQTISDRGYPEDRMRAVQAEKLSAVIYPQQCSDGMSDRSYALEAFFLLQDASRPMLAGCCSIAP